MVNSQKAMGVSNIHQIDLPKRVVIGNNVLGDIANHIAELGLGKRITIVTGSGVTKSYGEYVRGVLIDRGFDVWIVSIDRATMDEVERVVSIVKEVKSDVVIGVGGGKAIDVAKYSSFLSLTSFVSVPTTPSHDGIASPFASIKDIARPISMRAVTPSLVVADIEIISRAPRRHIISGCADLLGKFSAVLDWRLAHRLKNEYYGEYAASLALLSAQHIVRYSEWFALKNIPKEAVRVLVEALISSGIAMAIAGSTRPASGSEHLIAHAIDVVANYPALHGEEVGIGSIVALYLHGRNWKKIRNVLKTIGAPTTAKEINISREQLLKALTIAHRIRQERYTILGENGMTIDAAENVARTTNIID